MPANPTPSIAPQPRRAQIPMAFVRAIARAYQKYRMDPTFALERAHIAPETLEDCEGRVTAAQFEALSWIAMQELDDEALGWFSRKLRWGSYGMLCRASLTSANLEIAIRRWRRHHRLLTDDINVQLEVCDDVAVLSIDESCDLGDNREFCLVTILRYVLGFACWAIDSKIPILSADFPYSEPPHSEIYASLFSKMVTFCASRASISFDARYLALPLQRDEAALNKMLKNALPLTVLPYRRDQLLIGRIQQILRMPNSNFPSAQELAEAFNISMRTLHRQLQKEGASLRQLKETARIERAKQTLILTNQPIKRVAFATGFQNEKSFARAFRQWTGETPSHFRKKRKPPK